MNEMITQLKMQLYREYEGNSEGKTYIVVENQDTLH